MKREVRGDRRLAGAPAAPSVLGLVRADALGEGVAVRVARRHARQLEQEEVRVRVPVRKSARRRKPASPRCYGCAVLSTYSSESEESARPKSAASCSVRLPSASFWCSEQKSRKTAIVPPRTFSSYPGTFAA